MKKTFLELIKFIQKTGGFMTTDLKKIMTKNKQSVTKENINAYLYLFQVLADRNYTSTQRGHYKYYTFDQQTLNEMLNRLTYMDIKIMWANRNIARNNPKRGIHSTPLTDTNGLTLLLM